ncbi:MAG: MBL fold metallo-hydrolase, partial [Rhodospirillaceae bacterium]|nr:MBL fold metallo-hydrolase [Rhodospirillaceae bacterium]
MLDIQHFYDDRTGTLSYVVADKGTGKAAILDAVLDYDAAGGRTSTHLADALIDHARAQGLTVQWILETHAHADHLSAGAYLRDALGARLAIGEHICAVQETWKGIYGIGEEFAPDGSQFDELFADGDGFRLGDVEVRAMHTPGHTPACLTYLADGAAFVGDTMFMPDFGTARCDFPGGDAAQLYRSIRRVLELAPETRLHMCHDYMPDGRPLAWSCTVAEQRRDNK